MDEISSNIVTDVSVPETKGLGIEEIKSMIEACGKTEDGESLKFSMDELKVALKANPAACAMLLPEDIGAMVVCLRKMTNKLVIADLDGSKKRAKKDDPKITQEQIDNLSAEDLL